MVLIIKPWFSYIYLKGIVKNIGNVPIENLKILLMLNGKYKGETYFLFNGNIGRVDVGQSVDIDTKYFVYQITEDTYSLTFYCIDGDTTFQLIPSDYEIEIIRPIGF